MDLYRKTCIRQEFVNFNPLIIRVMRIRLLSLSILFSLISFQGSGQINDSEISLLKRLDSIAKSSSISSHFAKLYLETTEEAIIFFRNEDLQKRSFIQLLEHTFAYYFFNSAEAYTKGEKISPVWKAYYEKPALKPLQYELLGINAHINGDIWQAMVKEFSLQEILENRKIFLQFQKGLGVVYRNFHEKAKQENQRIKTLNNLSLGIDHFYGRLMLKRWRNRQIRLAEWYFDKPEKMKAELIRLDKKMNRINRLILHHL